MRITGHIVFLSVSVAIAGCGEDQRTPNQSIVAEEPAKQVLAEAPRGAYTYDGIWMGMSEAALRGAKPEMMWINCSEDESTVLDALKNSEALGDGHEEDFLSYCEADEVEQKVLIGLSEAGKDVPYLALVANGNVTLITFQNLLMETEKFSAWLIEQIKTNGKPDVSSFSTFSTYEWKMKSSARSSMMAETVEGVKDLVELNYYLTFVSDEEIAAEEKQKAEKAAHEAKYGKWHPFKSTDEMTDTPWTALRLSEDYGNASYLTARCKDNTTGFYVDWGQYLGIDGVHRVNYRIDDGDVQDSKWQPSTTRTASFATNPIRFMQQLMNGENLVISTKKYDQTTVSATFDIRSLDTASEDIQNMCEWDAALARIEQVEENERKKPAEKQARLDAFIAEFRKSAAERGDTSAYNWRAGTLNKRCRGFEDMVCREAADKVYDEIKF